MIRIPADQLVPARQYTRTANDSLIDLFATMKRTGKGDARKEQENIRRAAQWVAERLGRYHVPPSLKQFDEKLRAALGQTIAAATLAQEGIDAGDVGRITKASTDPPPLVSYIWGATARLEYFGPILDPSVSN